MESQKTSIKPIAYTYGLYLALINIVALVIMYVANLDKSWVMSIASALLTIAVFVYGIKAFKEQNNNFLSIGEAIKVGLAIAVIGGLIAAVYAYIHYSYVYPEFIEMTKEAAYNEMTTKNPDMTDEQINKAMDISGMFMNPLFFSLTTILGSLLFGLIVSLITGAIMKKENTHA